MNFYLGRCVLKKLVIQPLPGLQLPIRTQVEIDKLVGNRNFTLNHKVLNDYMIGES